MLDFVYYPVSGILWFWHKVFSLVSGSPDNGVVWALSVVFLVFTLKALLFKPFVKQVRTQLVMQKLQPQIKALQKKYSGDRQKLTVEMAKLQKEHNYSPLLGCLPMLVQVPVFWAYYTVLSITIEMRHAPFFGWIKDLSAPDPTNIFTLFGLVPWDPTAVPVIGHFLALGIWPLIMGFTMFVQMKMNPEPPDPIQKQMFTWMPVIFTFMLGSFPAGLVIYWAWNNLLSVTQQGFIMKRNGVKIELFDNLRKTFSRKTSPAAWERFAAQLDYVPLAAGAPALKEAVARAEASLGVECRRLHYLSVPPSAALPVVRMLGEAELVERSRIVMEKPFGTDLASARVLNAKLHEVFDEEAQ